MKLKFISIIACLLLCIGCNSQNEINVLSPQEFATAISTDSNAIVLDVRQLKEFESGHLENAIQLNFLDKAVFEKGIKDLDKSKTYYLYCRSGRRSNSAALMMKKEGFKVFDLKGGILAWEKTGFPILR
jgi:rhodanese-related sulfurtransferase